MDSKDKNIVLPSSDIFFNLRTEIGFFLAIAGVQFATIIRNIFPSLELVNMTMALSVILVINYKNIARFKLPCMSKNLLLIILLQVLMIMYNLLSSKTNLLYLLYQGYIISFVFALSTQSKNKTFKYFDKITFFATFFISLVVAFQATFGFSDLFLSNDNPFYKEDPSENGLVFGGDKITIGRTLGLCIITVIVLKSNFAWIKILKIFAFIFSLIGLIAFNTRAVIIGIIFFFFLKEVFYNSKNSLKSTLKKVFIFLLLTTVFLSFAYFFIPFLHDFMDKFFISIQRGISTFIFGQSQLGTDQSTITRYLNIIFAKETILNSSFKELFLGHTVIKYIDIPIIQSFIDFGFIGASLYLYIMIYLPIIFIFKYNNGVSSIQILQLFAFQYVIDQFYCADPYYFYHFMPISLLCFFYTNNKRLFS